MFHSISYLAPVAVGKLKRLDVGLVVDVAKAIRLIAIMLARLRMTEQSCMDAFKKHAEDVFSQPRLPLNTFLPVAKYGDKALRKATDLIIESAIAQNPALKYHESKLISLETPLKNCQW